MERWRIGCECAIVLARHFCILLLREREGEGLVVLPSSSSNETTAYAFRVALDIIIIIIHFCHSAVTYIHYTSTLVLRRENRKKGIREVNKKRAKKIFAKYVETRYVLFAHTKEEQTASATLPPMSWMYDVRLYTTGTDKHYLRLVTKYR